MSFGGAVAAMVTLIKNNTRSKRESYFDSKNISWNKKNSLKKLLEKKASAKQLQNIKDRMRRENKKALQRSILILFITILFLFCLYIGTQWLWNTYFR